MRIKLLLLIIVCSMGLQAQVEVARLRAASSPFRQTRSTVMLQTPEIRNGHFEYTAPDRIVWKYDGLENLVLPEQMLSMIRQSVSGDMAQLEGLFIAEWQDKLLTLTPRKKQMKRFFERIQILFTKEGVAQEVVLTEPGGDQTKIEFTNLKYTKI